MDNRLAPIDDQRSISILDELIAGDNQSLRWIVMGLLLVFALISFFVIGPWAGSPASYASTIASLDAKRANVMSLVAGSTGTSAAITLLPGDIGTPVAEQLLNLGSLFAIVLGALFLEKYLLTILGIVSFRLLIPLACVLLALGLAPMPSLRLSDFLQNLALRLMVFGFILFLVVPASIFIADRVDETYQTSVQASLDAAAKASVQAPTDQETTSDAATGILGMIQQLPENISESVQGVSQEAQDTLNTFIETLAVMIVTSCVIPMMVLLFFLWFARGILGVGSAAVIIPKKMNRACL